MSRLNIQNTEQAYCNALRQLQHNGIKSINGLSPYDACRLMMGKKVNLDARNAKH